MDLLSSIGLGYLVALCFGILIVRSVKRRYLSALHTIPGPFAASITRAWRIKEVYYGHVEKTELNLHELHGMNLHFSSNINGNRDAETQQALSCAQAPMKWLQMTSMRLSCSTVLGVNSQK